MHMLLLTSQTHTDTRPRARTHISLIQDSPCERVKTAPIRVCYQAVQTPPGGLDADSFRRVYGRNATINSCTVCFALRIASRPFFIERVEQGAAVGSSDPLKMSPLATNRSIPSTCRHMLTCTQANTCTDIYASIHSLNHMFSVSFFNTTIIHTQVCRDRASRCRRPGGTCLHIYSRKPRRAERIAHDSE